MRGLTLSERAPRGEGGREVPVPGREDVPERVELGEGGREVPVPVREDELWQVEFGRRESTVVGDRSRRACDTWSRMSRVEEGRVDAEEAALSR